MLPSAAASADPVASALRHQPHHLLFIILNTSITITITITIAVNINITIATPPLPAPSSLSTVATQWL